MKKRAFIWSLTGISAALGFMLTVQITSHSNSSESSLSSYLDLRSQIQEQTQEREILESEIAKQNTVLLQYQRSSGETSDMLQALKQDEKSVQMAAGITPISGPGVTIQIQFDPNLPFNEKTAGLFDQISDQELGLIVNDLFANGATAISINGQRLVTTSSIRLVSGLSDTTTLQVNTVPITAPYVISAIGDVNRMQAILTINNVQAELNLMQEDCLITPHNGTNGVTVAGYSGPLPGHFAKEVNNP